MILLASLVAWGFATAGAVVVLKRVPLASFRAAEAGTSCFLALIAGVLAGLFALFNVEINSYTKDGVTKTNNKFGTTFDVSPLDPLYAQIEKLKLEEANGSPGETAQASAPAQMPAPATMTPAQAPAIVGRRRLAGIR